MSTATAIKIDQFLKKSDKQQLFTIRDLVHLGTRAAVDSKIYALRKKGLITRIAQGVYCHPQRRLPVSVVEIAKVKARSFRHQLFTHASSLSNKWVFSTKNKIEHSASENKHFFASTGGNSRFKFGSVEVHFRNFCERKIELGDSSLGKILRAFCYLGREIVEKGLFQFICSGVWRQAFLPLATV